MDYNLLETFCKVAELGSFTKAAASLKQPKSRISRAISKIEAELGVQLINRTTRRSSLTNTGNRFYASVAPLLSSLRAEVSKVSSKHLEMSGLIKITASQDIGQTVVTQLINEFSSRYPDVYFETLITNEFLDLTKHDIDIAFRAGKLADSSLKQKKVISARFILVCSPDYIERFGAPRDVLDLEKHRFLSFRNMEKSFISRCPPITPKVVSDSMPMLMNMALDGNGITMLPDFFCKTNIESKRLIQILPACQSKVGEIHMLYSPAKEIPKKVRTFIDFVIETQSKG